MKINKRTQSFVISGYMCKAKLLSNIKKPTSIRSKLITAFMVPILLIIILGIASYVKSSNAVFNIAQKSTLATMDSTSKYIEAIFSNIADTSMQILTDQDLQNYLILENKNDSQVEPKKDFLSSFRTKQKIEQRITSFISANKNISSISVIASEDNSITPTSIYRGVTMEKLKNTELGKKITEADKSPVWVGLHSELDNISGSGNASSDSDIKYLSSVLRAIKNIDSGETVGYIVIDLNQKYISEFLSGICKNLGEGSELHLISPDKRDFVSRTVTDVNADNKIKITDQKFYNDILSGKNMSGSSIVAYIGKQYLASYYKLEGNGYILIGLIPVSSLSAASRSIAMTTIIIVLLAILIAFGIGIYLATGMSKTIKDIIATTGQAASGDLTVNCVTKRRDEFGILSQSINSMIGKMRLLVEKIVEVTQKVAESSLTVSTTSEQVSLASHNVSFAIQEISQGAIAQASDAELGAKKIRFLAGKINNVTENARSIDNLTKGAMALTQAGLTSIENLEKKANETTRISGEITADIRELNSHSKSIEKIVEVIKEIADQTNLLALNAAIEAARAGEVGRGFAVVADEVRKLAEQSMRASQEITSIIKYTQNQTAKAAEKAVSTEVILKSQNEAVLSTIDVFREIESSMGNLTNQVDQIMSGTVEMEEHKEHAIHSIENISAVSEETAASSEEVTASTQEQLSCIEELASFAKELEQMAKELERSISIFKIN